MAQVDGSGTADSLSSAMPLFTNCPKGVSVNIPCSVIENGPVSETRPEPSWWKLSAKPTAVVLKVSIKLPGVSVAVSAPCPFNGSSYQFKVALEPFAICHVPAPAVVKALTGPKKSVSPIAKTTVLAVAVVLITDNEDELRVLSPGLAGVPVDIWIELLT